MGDSKNMKLVAGRYVAFDGTIRTKYAGTLVVPAGSRYRGDRMRGCIQVLVPGGNWRRVEGTLTAAQQAQLAAQPRGTGRLAGVP